MSFQNKRYFKKQSFDLSESSVKIHKKGLFDEIEYEVSLEHIHNIKTIQTQINNNLLISGIFFFVFSFLFLLGTAEQLTFIFAGIGVIFVFSAFINRTKTVSILTYSGEPITLYFTNSNKQDVVNFSNKIIEASDKYLLNKYTKIDRDLPIEPQLQHLNFLLDREIISESQFELFKNQLLGRNGKSTIGFAN